LLIACCLMHMLQGVIAAAEMPAAVSGRTAYRGPPVRPGAGGDAPQV